MRSPILCVSICVALLGTMVIPGPAGGSVAYSQGDSAAAELIERVLNPPQPEMGQQSTRRLLLLGALPAGLPSDVPLPTGRLVGSTARVSEGQVVEVHVLVDVPGAPDEVRREYAEEVTRRGWTPPAGAPFTQQGGFRSAPRSPGGLYCQEGGPISLQLGADEGLHGHTEVRLDISLTGYALCSPSFAPFSPPPSLSPYSPAAAQPSTGFSPPTFSPPGLGPGFRAAPVPPPDLIPHLLPPEGVSDPSEVQTPSGFPGSGGAPASSQATLRTELTAQELEAHYGRQLEAAGWVRLSSGGERLAWSRWRASADEAWEGLFLAFEEPSRPQRFVRFAVDATLRTPERVEPRPLGGLDLTDLESPNWGGPRLQPVRVSRNVPMAPVPGSPLLVQEEVSPLEAAERLLSRPARDLVGRRLSTRLLPEALPNELAAFPLPTNSHLVGTSVHFADHHLLSADVMLDAGQPPHELLAFFNAELQRLGWTSAPRAMTGVSGIFPGGTEMSELCQSESGPYVRISLHPHANGGSQVQVQAEIGETDRCLRQTRSSRPLSSELLPPLSGPAREPVSFSGRGQGRTETAVEATISTEATVQRLDANFAEQLASGGWTRLVAGGDGSLAWSLWSLPDYGDWEALVILTPGPSDGRRTLFIRLKSWQDA